MQGNAMGMSGTHAGADAAPSHLALVACPGQQLIVGEGLAGPAWSINEDEPGLCEVGMPARKLSMAALPRLRTFRWSVSSRRVSRSTWRCSSART